MVRGYARVEWLEGSFKSYPALRGFEGASS